MCFLLLLIHFSRSGENAIVFSCQGPHVVCGDYDSLVSRQQAEVSGLQTLILYEMWRRLRVWKVKPMQKCLKLFSQPRANISHFQVFSITTRCYTGMALGRGERVIDKYCPMVAQLVSKRQDGAGHNVKLEASKTEDRKPVMSRALLPTVNISS